MKNIIDENKKDEFDTKKSYKNKRRGKNISYDYLFNSKTVKVNLLKGDQNKINNAELETKLQVSINKKNNLLIYKKNKINKNSNRHLIKDYHKTNGIHFNKNSRSNTYISNTLHNNGVCFDKSFDKNINKGYTILSNNKTNNLLINSESSDNSSELMLEKIFEKGLTALDESEIIIKEDKNNPYIYSYTDWHPFSFCTGHRKWGYENGKLKSPSPIFLDNEEWCQKKILSKNVILKGTEIREDVGLLLVDPFISEKFNGMLADLIKQILKIVFGHKISLNVKLFEPISMTQCLLNYFSFVPKYIASSTNQDLSPLERMKNVIAMGISGLYMNAKQLKPFNPLICETFQGFFDVENIDIEENLIEAFSEQISNYPTLTRYYILNKNFKMYGYFDLSLETKSFGNKIIMYTKGTNTVDFFKIDEKIHFSIPSGKILNAIAKEDRSAHYVGVMIFFDIKNNLRAFVQFGNDNKHISDITGCIFRYNFPQDYKFNFDKEYEMFGKIDLNNFKKNNIFKEDDVVSTISGSWLKQLIFDDNNKYWDIDEDLPTYIRPSYNCLPSDSRFREDLIWLYRSFYKSKNETERLYYEKLAQNWKLMIEKVQREERTEKAKLNEELAKKAKMNKK